MRTTMVAKLTALVKLVLRPAVVVWFWFARWVAHNEVLFWFKPLGKKPSVFAYPFMFLHYLLEFLGKCWRLAFADYGLKIYIPLIKRHYAKDGLGMALPEPEEFKKCHDGLQPRIPYFLDHAPHVLTCENTDSFLDAGCGFGANIKALTRRFPNSKIHAFDISPNAVEFVSRSGYGENVTCREGSVTDEAFLASFASGSFDWVLYSHALSFLMEGSCAETENMRRRTIAELFRIARKGLIVLEHAPSERVSFAIEQNTRATYKTDIVAYFEALDGELYMARHAGIGWAYMMVPRGAGRAAPRTDV